MAFNPCSAGNHWHPRKNYLVYIAHGRGEAMVRYRLRFCLTHIALVQEQLSEFEVDPDNGAVSGGDAAMSNCFSCGQPLDETRWQLFATCYPPNDERKDYWAGIHSSCTLPDPLSDQWSVKSA